MDVLPECDEVQLDAQALSYVDACSAPCAAQCGWYVAMHAARINAVVKALANGDGSECEHVFVDQLMAVARSQSEGDTGQAFVKEGGAAIGDGAEGESDGAAPAPTPTAVGDDLADSDDDGADDNAKRSGRGSIDSSSSSKRRRRGLSLSSDESEMEEEWNESWIEEDDADENRAGSQSDGTTALHHDAQADTLLKAVSPFLFSTHHRCIHRRFLRHHLQGEGYMAAGLPTNPFLVNCVRSSLRQLCLVDVPLIARMLVTEENGPVATPTVARRATRLAVMYDLKYQHVQLATRLCERTLDVLLYIGVPSRRIQVAS